MSLLDKIEKNNPWNAAINTFVGMEENLFCTQLLDF